MPSRRDDQIALHGLFQEMHPRLTVFRDTVDNNDENEDANNNSISSRCPFCLEAFVRGEKVYSLSCNNLHIVHVACFAMQMTVSARAILHRSLNCPMCRQPVIPYPVISNMAQRYNCLFALGTIQNSEASIPFACLEGEEQRFLPTSSSPFLPWGNFRRYISASSEMQNNSYAAPQYIVDVVESTRPPLHNSINLRTNRPRLCEVPMLKKLKSDLVRDRPSVPERNDALQKYLLADITNVLYIASPTFFHIYLQLRVNCGAVAWFGFREFRHYILQQFNSWVDRDRFYRAINELCLRHRISNFPEIGHLSDAIRSLDKFDGEVGRRIGQWQQDSAVRERIPQFQRLHGNGPSNAIWRAENQSARRPGWRSELHELDTGDWSRS